MSASIAKIKLDCLGLWRRGCSHAGFDDFSSFGDEEAAGVGAEKRDVAGALLRRDVGGVGGDRPLDLAHATRGAERVNDALRLDVRDESGHAIHASLPVHSVSKRCRDVSS